MKQKLKEEFHHIKLESTKSQLQANSLDNIFERNFIICSNGAITQPKVFIGAGPCCNLDSTRHLPE